MTKNITVYTASVNLRSDYFFSCVLETEKSKYKMRSIFCQMVSHTLLC